MDATAGRRHNLKQPDGVDQRQVVSVHSVSVGLCGPGSKRFTNNKVKTSTIFSRLQFFHANFKNIIVHTNTNTYLFKEPTKVKIWISGTSIKIEIGQKLRELAVSALMME